MHAMYANSKLIKAAGYRAMTLAQRGIYLPLSHISFQVPKAP